MTSTDTGVDKLVSLVTCEKDVTQGTSNLLGNYREVVNINLDQPEQFRASCLSEHCVQQFFACHILRMGKPLMSAYLIAGNFIVI